MLFTSFSQLIVLVILFFGGLILGLGLHPGGRKWRQRFKDESENYAQFRRDADVRLRDANRRIGELEREKASLQDSEATARQSLSDAQQRMAGGERTPRPGTPIVAAEPSGAVLHPVPMPPIASSAAVSAFPAGGTSGNAAPTPADEPPHGNSWFSGDHTADIGRIRGIDPALKTSLFGLGVTRFQDITAMSAVDEMALEQRLSLPAGFIAREQWREQAELLRDGRDAEHADRFPPHG